MSSNGNGISVSPVVVVGSHPLLVRIDRDGGGAMIWVAGYGYTDSDVLSLSAAPGQGCNLSLEAVFAPRSVFIRDVLLCWERASSHVLCPSGIFTRYVQLVYNLYTEFELCTCSVIHTLRQLSTTERTCSFVETVCTCVQCNV